MSQFHEKMNSLAWTNAQDILNKKHSVHMELIETRGATSEMNNYNIDAKTKETIIKAGINNITEIIDNNTGKIISIHDMYKKSKTLSPSGQGPNL